MEKVLFFLTCIFRLQPTLFRIVSYAHYSNCYVRTVGESSPQRLVLPPTGKTHLPGDCARIDFEKA